MDVQVRRNITDPIHGTIKIPPWLTRIINEKPIRRMMFIRQLGLKSYIDFPGAIHTRYSHALGVMYLAEKLTDMLAEKEENKGQGDTAANIRGNKANIMAAGFFHDIGHGPFSHVVDYILKKYSKFDHSELVPKIINEFGDLENWNINQRKVHEIIIGEHEYPFINHLINGPIDADKLDYLLRDAYHVGLKYSFDLNHFIDNFLIIGNSNEGLKFRELGISADLNSQVSTEIFFVIWKSMYDLVYHIEDSRIAEKMLEKSIIIKINEDKDFRNRFAQMKNSKIDGFMELDDDKILSILKNGKGLSATLANNIIDNRLYKKVLDKRLYAKSDKEGNMGESYSIDVPFLNDLDESEELSDNISIQLSKHYRIEKYDIICDILKSRIPATLHIEKFDDNDEPMEFKSISKLISNLDKVIKIKVYVNPQFYEKVKGEINKVTQDIICDWGN